eukprot:scaffold16043_cov115-Isochrysis_galbana.AAC.8
MACTRLLTHGCFSHHSVGRAPHAPDSLAAGRREARVTRHGRSALGTRLASMPGAAPSPPMIHKILPAKAPRPPFARQPSPLRLHPRKLPLAIVHARAVDLRQKPGLPSRIRQEERRRELAGLAERAERLPRLRQQQRKQHALLLAPPYAPALGTEAHPQALARDVQPSVLLQSAPRAANVEVLQAYTIGQSARRKLERRSVEERPL